jgi:hypothetical protein
MALGMGETTFLAYRRIPRTIYSASKRHGERLAVRLGRKLGKEVYVLRLGQVHGELQGVTRNILWSLRRETAYVPRSVSYTVFTYTIAEALANIAAGRERPGVYSLVSAPEWSWREVHEYYCRRAGIEPRIVEEPCPPRPSFRPDAWLRQRIMALARANQELGLAYVLRHLPALELRARSRYHTQRAAAEIAEARGADRYRPFRGVVVGDVPGRRLQHLSDSRSAMIEGASRVQAVLDQAGRVAGVEDGPTP